MSEVPTNDASTGNAAEAPVKTAKQLEKEAQKAAKLAKLAEKQKKKAAEAEKKAAEPAKEVSIFILKRKKMNENNTISLIANMCYLL